MTEKAAILARVSTKGQEKKENPLNGQLSNCREWATSHRYDVVAEFKEVGSGFAWVFDRPTIGDLWKLVEAKQISVIIVDDMDRVAREPDYQTYLIVDAAKHGVRIEAVAGNADDSFEGRLVTHVTKLYAKYENTKRQHRTERGRKARAESGKPISASLPYGYRWFDPEPRKKTRMIVHEEEAKIVRRIFEWLANGGTATSLMQTLNAEGIPSPQAREGQLNLWSTKTIGRIVRNDSYIGKAWAFKSESLYEPNKRTRLPNRPEADRVALPEGTIPAIIDEATFRSADERLVRNRREATRNSRNPALYLLRGGFAKCHHCGGTLEACIAPRGDRYYRCIPAQRRKHSCPSCSIKAEELERGVWDYVLLVLENPAYIEQHAKRQAEDDKTSGQIDTLDRALVGLSQQADNLLATAAMAIDDHSRQFIAAKLDDIASQRRALSERRNTLLDLQAAHQRTKAMLGGLSDIWSERYAEIDAMTMAERRDVLADFGVKVTVYPKDHKPRWEVDMLFDLSSWFDPTTGFLLEEPDDSPDTLQEWAAVPVGNSGIVGHQSGPGPR